MLLLQEEGGSFAMNNRGDADIGYIIMFVLLFCFLFLVMLVGVIASINDKACENACGGKVIDFESKTKGSTFEWFTRTDKMSCICYYYDVIEVEAVRK